MGEGVLQITCTPDLRPIRNFLPIGPQTDPMPVLLDPKALQQERETEAWGVIWP